VGAWKSTTRYPKSTMDLSCAANSGFIYCVGGTVPINTPIDAAYFAPISSSGVGAWKSTTPYPTRVRGLSCATYSGFIYCAGGVEYLRLDAAYFAPISSTGVGKWTKTTSYPTSVWHQSCAIDSGYIYCIGGDTDAGDTDAVYFAPVSSGGVGSWTSTTRYPAATMQLSCAVNSGFIYCVGGNTSKGATNAVYFASLSIITKAVGTWTSTTKYPIVIADQSCVTSTSYLYCVGGSTTGGNGLTDAVNFAPVLS
jgi:N-acetylneuraminic acid mutarotase